MCPAQDGPDAGDQLLETEGLGHVVVAAERQSPDPVSCGIAGRQEQDGGSGALVAEPLGHLEPVPVGEHDVEDDEVWPERGDAPECLTTCVGHLDLEPLVSKGRGQEVGDVLLVVHHEDPGVLGHRLLAVHHRMVGRNPVRTL